MKIPKGNLKCQKWFDKLKSGTKTVAKNIEAENCIPEDVCDEFFDDIERHLSSKKATSVQKNAVDNASHVVKNKPDRFLCCGRQIDDNLFVTLCRLDHVETLPYRVPDCRRRLGIPDQDTVGSLPEEEIRSLVDEYDGPIDLGNNLGICFVTDKAYLELSDIRMAFDRFGLDNFDLGKDKYYVLCVYKRDKIDKTLHLPRVFDAINQRAFFLEKDCNALYGKTRPLTCPPEQGIPEAVHRKCSVEPEIFRLEKIT